MELASIPRVTRTVGVCGGKACITGHRIRVSDVALWHEQAGMTPDEIVNEHPGITLSDVHSALAWYFDHVDEIQEEIRAERLRVEQFRNGRKSLLEVHLRNAGMAEAS